MKLGRGIAALMAAMAAMVAGASAPPELPPDTVLLLVAPWCAPCWGELGRLDALAAAAAPMQLRVVVMEDGARARAMLADIPPERRWVPAADDRLAVRAALWARTPGLPYSVATNRQGRVCAERGGGLDAARAAALVRQCLSAQ